MVDIFLLYNIIQYLARTKPFDAVLGFGAGTVVSIFVVAPKAVTDLVAGFVGMDTKPLRLGKAGVDGAIGGLAAYDVYTHPERDDFWKFAEGTFAFWEILYAVLTGGGVISDYLAGRSSSEQKTERSQSEFARY